MKEPTYSKLKLQSHLTVMYRHKKIKSRHEVYLVLACFLTCDYFRFDTFPMTKFPTCVTKNNNETNPQP